MGIEESIPNNRSLAERMFDCPIHKWAWSKYTLGVTAYLISYEVPISLWELFHELVIARGQYPPFIEDKDAKRFAKEAVELTKDGNPLEMESLGVIFQDFIREWINDKIRQQ